MLPDCRSGAFAVRRDEQRFDPGQTLVELDFRGHAAASSLRQVDLMRAGHLESFILFVSDLAQARAFYADALGLPVLFEDEIIVVVGDQSGRVVLHRNDRGHDERGIFPLALK